MKRHAWLVIGVALLVAFLVYAFLSRFEYVTTEVEGEPSGPASYNPLYALHQLLQSLDAPSTTRAYLDLEQSVPDTYGTLVTVADPGTLGSGQVEQLLGWVETGGHLVVALPAHGEIVAGTLLSSLGVRFVESGADACVAVPLDVTTHAETLFGCGLHRFELEYHEPVLGLRDAQGLLLARLSLGEGFVTVTSSLGFLMNDALRDAGNARLAMIALAPNFGMGSFDLVYSVQAESLLRILVTRGWPALSAFAVLLLAWLSMRMRRFGPPQGHDARPRRALLEHVAASARFLERSGLSETLRAASERRLLRLLRKRHPHIAAMKTRERNAALAGRTGMKESDIARAFAPATQPIGSAERIMLLAKLGKML